MHAIRAAHAFDGNRFLPGGATVLVDGDRIAGVDSGMGPPKRHGNLWRTAGEMVEGGYPAADALAAATSVAAQACGLAAQTGRLAPGHAADVLVADGDLSQDVSTLSSPRAVLVNGIPAHLHTSEPSAASPR